MCVDHQISNQILFCEINGKNKQIKMSVFVYTYMRRKGGWAGVSKEGMPIGTPFHKQEKIVRSVKLLSES